MKNILLIGTGHFGHHIAVQLAQLGHQVMAVDSREDRINEILPFVTSAQIVTLQTKNSFVPWASETMMSAL